MTPKQIIDTLRRRAKAQGVTNYRLAARSGVSQATISRVFAGKSAPDVGTVVKLAASLGLRVEVVEDNGG